MAEECRAAGLEVAVAVDLLGDGRHRAFGPLRQGGASASHCRAPGESPILVYEVMNGLTARRDHDVDDVTVARRSGYATPFAFTHAFRRKYGVPPGRYRVDRSAR
jgi:hypothetical protein